MWSPNGRRLNRDNDYFYYYFLKFRITTPDDLPDGTFTLTDTTHTISDVETFYDFTVGGSIGRIDVTSMTVTFSNFDSCLNHEIKINFSDNEFLNFINKISLCSLFNCWLSFSASKRFFCL